MGQKIKRYLSGKPNLVIAHPKENIKQYPFNIPEYKESYLDFAKLAEKKFNVFFVRNVRRYTGRGIFQNGYRYANGKISPYLKKIAAKVVYNKTGLHANGGSDWSIVNKYRMFEITTDKYRSYLILKKFMKPTYRIKSKRDFIRIIKKISTKIAVFKPLRGGGGQGIIISEKLKLAKKIKHYNGILQEFIDTSGGIPGICSSMHDLRILIMNGVIRQTYIRIPKKGSLLANIARGGTMKEIKIKAIPPAVRKIALTIDKRFYQKFGPRIYSIDFGYEDGRPYLIEINAQPGLPFKRWLMYYSVWHKELLNTLLQATK